MCDCDQVDKIHQHDIIILIKLTLADQFDLLNFVFSDQQPSSVINMI